MSGSGEQAGALRAQEQERMIADFKRAVEVSHRARHPRSVASHLPVATFALSIVALIVAILAVTR